ncbi:MAG: radical SAM protein [Caldilineaceae bacterium]
MTLSFDGRINLSFDGEGRLVGAFWDKMTYRRSLDNRVLVKWTDHRRPQRRRRRFLNGAECKKLLGRVYDAANDVSAALANGLLAAPADAPLPEIQDWLSVVLRWDWPKLTGERRRFLDVYKPVPILPPDQYLSTVLQVTEGCSYNECTFCTFYRDRPFRIKTGETLTRHIAAVQEFLGEGQALRRGVFLADANAVIVAQRTLIPMLDAVNAAMPVAQTGGIYAFISAPDAMHKSSADFAELRARNLRRVYVGVESGHDPLRQFLRKPGNAADVRHAIQTIKAGGVSVGLILMVGVGGERFRQDHRRDTLDLLTGLPLDSGDLIYLSPFVASVSSPYVQDAEAADLRP